ncbi:MAG: PorT family protein [Terrimonas sp.]|nr:PorT family protein [Terrimonas sp.]
MKTRSILFGITMLLLSASIYAQKIRVGISAGPVLSNMFSKVDDEKETVDMKAGFAAGLAVNAAITENIDIQSGLNFVQKGGKEKDDGYKFTLSLNYVELPVNFVYHFGEKQNSFFVGLGPTLAMGISGKMKAKIEGFGTESEKIKFGNDPDKHDFKRMDVGANILAGYHVSPNLFISAQYNHGFSNLFIDDSDDAKLNNRYWALKVGWLFGN